ncbi:hypothetical protein GCM10010412_101220 [Nonomuraea recticatena]|uniref:Uncharacterized protein n=1 Tax=Nonomuraea recticatena TaxID=46178 RepID=A0ABN3TJ93_9ACTN
MAFSGMRSILLVMALLGRGGDGGAAKRGCLARCGCRGLAEEGDVKLAMAGRSGWDEEGRRC